jgi:8-oxo-dGTP diphosphatase
MDSPSLKVGAGIVIVKDGKTLLTKRRGSHAAGCWQCVGGHVEFGESPMETVKREAHEELGIEIGNLRLAACTNMIKYGKHYLDLTFAAEILVGEPRIIEPEKMEEIRWFPLDELPEPLFEPIRIALEARRTGEVYFEIKEINECVCP